MNNRPPAPSRGEPVEVVAGRQIVVRMAGLVRGCRLYDLSNHVIQTQIQDLLTNLQQIDGPECTLVAMGEHVYMNGERIKSSLIQMIHFSSLTAELQSRGLGGLRFLRGLTADEVAGFLRIFLAATDRFQGGALPEAVAEAGILNLIPVLENDVGGLELELEPVDEAEDRTEAGRARRTYTKAVAGTRAMWESTARTGRPALRQARRVVQPLVDTLMKNEYSILGLAALKNHDEYTYSHCVNVSTLSIAIGHRLGMNRCNLASLGVAALLHDVGKLVVPPEVLRKAGKLTPEEWSYVRRHPLEGVRMVSRLPGLSETILYTMWVCLQHHLSMDGRGYPHIEGDWTLRPISRIVAAADCYDAMTGHRAYRARPMTGHEALQQMLGPEEMRFDPAVAWALVSAVGAYPAGTVLQMKSGFRVLSTGPNPVDPRRPNCRILNDPEGKPPEPGGIVFWQPMPENEIVDRVITPEEHQVDVEDLLAA